jgi:hypothetical protein
MVDFDIAKAAGTCSMTGRGIEPGERFYTAVFESPEGFERRDFSEAAWQGPPEGSLCHFQTRMPSKDAPRRLFVGDEALIGFFTRLGETVDPAKLRFRFVLSLILLRKRILKYERTLRDGPREVWRMRLVRDKSLHDVENPSLTDEQIEALTGELGAILAAGADDDEAVAPGGEPIGEAAQKDAAP